MPVGTQATVKALSSARARAARGAQIILGNTYHLLLRPGAERVARARRPAPVHELAARRSSPTRAASRCSACASAATIDDDGVTFRSHLDGSEQRLTPERAMAIQAALGATSRWRSTSARPRTRRARRSRRAMARTTRWARRCLAAPARARPAALRHRAGRRRRRPAPRAHRRRSRRCPSTGCALGGLGVGEPTDGDVRGARRGRRRAARRAPALPHGRRARPRTSGRRSAPASTCSTA